ncbi:MAG: hypothetical protein ACP5LR_08835, partial [Athalassotoga sp.]|uniref:hypothetical protein n=1 Tax=Athalassotoga sp. TaxID=2022597 RepID=UPI003D02D579
MDDFISSIDKRSKSIPLRHSSLNLVNLAEAILVRLAFIYELVLDSIVGKEEIEFLLNSEPLS